jgi:predicted  nucleic acid-binding Zn-ribbon protein
MTDEPTQNFPPDKEDRVTQPSITAVFELIQDVKRVVDNNGVRLNGIELRIKDMELQIKDMELQIKNGFSMLGNKIDALNRSRLQTEADYFNLLQRIEELESKAS